MGAPGWRGAGLADFQHARAGEGCAKLQRFPSMSISLPYAKGSRKRRLVLLASVDGFSFTLGLVWVCQCSLVWVYAGLLLSALVVCVSWIFSLSLLATVRGSTSFLCKRAKKRSKERVPIIGKLVSLACRLEVFGT